MITTIIHNEVATTIHGPAGQLEVLTAEPLIAMPRRAWGIVCHPHPLYGGTMHNKIVTTLSKVFRDLGAVSVRFNFRGVGKSEGKYDNGEGELDDLLAVVDWVLQERPDHEIWLAGFSFGAYIALQAATRIPIAKLVTVAPPVNHFHLEQLPAITCQWLLVQGERDEVVPPQEVFAWAEKRDPKPTIIRFPNATHFFHGELQALHTQLVEALGGVSCE